MIDSCIGLDIETSKTPNHFPWRPGYYLSLVCISYPDDTSKSWVFNHSSEPDYDPDKNFREIQAEIDKFNMVACHNAKFELNNLRKHLTFKKIFCTMVAQYLLNCHSQKNLDLDSLPHGLPSKDPRVKKMWDSGIDTHDIPISILDPYCIDDARKCRIMCEKQSLDLYNKGLTKVFELQMRWLDMLSFMETKGIGWDNNKATSIVTKYRKYSSILENKIKKTTPDFVQGEDLNLLSNDDLSVLLYGGTLTRKRKVPVIKTKNIKTKVPYVFTYKDGRRVIKQRWVSHPDTRIIRMVYNDVPIKCRGLGITPRPKSEVAKHTPDKPFYKVDKDTLPYLRRTTALQKTIVQLLCKKSSIDKVISTFESTSAGNVSGLMAKIGTDNKLHTNYNQCVTGTGRLSSSDPNSQNLPRSGTSPVKECFIPELDKITNGDLSQVEWRIPAQMSGDPIMIREIQNGMDCHSENCQKLMLLPLTKMNRFYAKIFNFRMIFRGSAWGYHRDPKMPAFGIKKWEQVVKAFWNKYCVLDQWHQQIIDHVINGDGTLSIFTGRRFKFHLNHQGKYNESQISNAPVQGFAGGDLLPLAAVIIWDAMKKRNLKSFPVLTVHDSLVFDTAADEVDILADLLMSVFTNLPKYIKQYWGYDWIVPLTGEVETGDNYGKQTQIR